MSWRILIEPAYFNKTPGDMASADWIIPLAATNEDVDKVSREAVGRLPLRTWTPSEQDARYLRLRHNLEEVYGEYPGRIFVKPADPALAYELE